MSLTKDAIESIKQTVQVLDGPDGRKYAVVPQHHAVSELEPYEAPLVRIVQRPTFFEPDSFVAYVNTFKGPETHLFALPGHLNNGAPYVSAVFDYHVKNNPGRCAHIATYTPRYSEQWLRWTQASKAAMSQAQFAEFVEENRADINTPAAAELLDIVRRFRATKKIEFNSVVYQPNGDVSLTWNEETKESSGKHGVTMPTELELGIPVYFKGTVYSVPILLKFSTRDGVLAFALKVDRADYIETAAFDELTVSVNKAIELPVHIGRI